MMTENPFWEVFCMTGEPLAYLLYRSAEEPDAKPE